MSLSKQDELDWLDRAITELGPNTYLGATFIDQRMEIESNIRCDLPALELTALHEAQLKMRREIHDTELELRKLADRRAELRLEIQGLEKDIDRLNASRHSTLTILRGQARNALNELRDLAIA